MNSYASAVKNDLHLALPCVSRLPAVVGAGSGASQATDRDALNRLVDATPPPSYLCPTIVVREGDGTLVSARREARADSGRYGPQGISISRAVTKSS